MSILSSEVLLCILIFVMISSYNIGHKIRFFLFTTRHKFTPAYRILFFGSFIYGMTSIERSCIYPQQRNSSRMFTATTPKSDDLRNSPETLQLFFLLTYVDLYIILTGINAQLGYEMNCFEYDASRGRNCKI